MDPVTNVRDMANSRAICAECGLEGWDGKCSECGGSSGLHPGSPKYAQVLALRGRSTNPSAIDAVIRHLQGAGTADYSGSKMAMRLGKGFQVLGWVIAVGSVIAGFIVMAQTESTGWRNEHPYVTEGVIILISGWIQGLALVMVGSYVQARLEFESQVGGLLKRFKTMRT